MNETKEQLIEIVKKPYVNARDIALLAQCGKTKSFKIKRDVVNKLKRCGKNVIDHRYISTLDVLMYLDNKTYLNYYKQYVGEIDNG